MTIEVRNTNDVHENGVKALVYGDSGIGKTTLMSTSPKPLIVSCEAGLLSIANTNTPYIQIDADYENPEKSLQDIYDALEFAQESEEAMQYETISLDSITEVAQVMLFQLKVKYKDPRHSYPMLADEMGKLMRGFRDLKGKNVLVSAKSARMEDSDTGTVTYKPKMPGKELLFDIPYIFDQVLFMTSMPDEDGIEYRVLKTAKGYGFDAKDRSRTLQPIEEPDMGKIIAKVKAGVIV